MGVDGIICDGFTMSYFIKANQDLIEAQPGIGVGTLGTQHAAEDILVLENFLPDKIKNQREFEEKYGTGQFVNPLEIIKTKDQALCLKLLR